MFLGLCDTWSPVYPKFEWVERGFQQLGHTTVRVRTEEDIAQANYCDFLVFSQNYPFPPTLFSPPKAIWVFDLIGHGIGDALRDHTPWSEFDYVFCKNPEILEHPNCHWLDQAAPDWPDVEYECKYDVIMPGRPRPERVRAVQAIRDAGINVAVAGFGWQAAPAIGTGLRITTPASLPYLGNCLTDSAMQKLFGSAKVILGSDYGNVIGYWSDRRWLAHAAGTPYVPIDDNMFERIISTLKYWDESHRSAQLTADNNRYRHRCKSLLSKVSVDSVHC